MPIKKRKKIKTKKRTRNTTSLRFLIQKAAVSPPKPEQVQTFAEKLDAKDVIRELRGSAAASLTSNEGPQEQSLPLDSLPKIKPPRTVGELLRHGRAKTGKSLREITEFLEIPSKYLEALERDDLRMFSAKIYAKGVLRRVVNFLKMPEREVTEAFEEQWSKFSPRESVIPRSLISRLPRFTITPRTLSLATGLLALFLIIGYFIYQISSLLAPPEITLKSPQAATITAGQDLIVEGEVADPEARLTLQGRVVYSDGTGRFREKLMLAPGVHTIEVVAENKFGKKNILTRTIAVEPAQSTTSATTTAP